MAINIKVTVIDLSGNIVKDEQTITTKTEKELEIDISSLNVGWGVIAISGKGHGRIGGIGLAVDDDNLPITLSNEIEVDEVNATVTDKLNIEFNNSDYELIITPVTYKFTDKDKLYVRYVAEEVT